MTDKPPPPPPIRCQLSGSNTAQACDVIARGHSPVLDMCRKLVAAGYDPSLPLECYRGEKIALRVRSIGEGAKLTVRETSIDGPRVVRWKPFPARAVAAPVDLNRLEAGVPSPSEDRNPLDSDRCRQSRPDTRGGLVVETGFEI